MVRIWGTQEMTENGQKWSKIRDFGVSLFPRGPNFGSSDGPRPQIPLYVRSSCSGPGQKGSKNGVWSPNGPGCLCILGPLGMDYKEKGSRTRSKRGPEMGSPEGSRKKGAKPLFWTFQDHESEVLRSYIPGLHPQ